MPILCPWHEKGNGVKKGWVSHSDIHTKGDHNSERGSGSVVN